MERKYSVAEIDQMRRALDWVVMINVSCREGDRHEAIEAQLRTYMLNGTEPDELTADCQRKTAERQRTMEMVQRIQNECART